MMVGLFSWLVRESAALAVLSFFLNFLQIIHRSISAPKVYAFFGFGLPVVLDAKNSH